VHAVFRKKGTIVKGIVCKQQCEQWENVKFCQKLGKSAIKTRQMIKQVYREEALGCSAAFKWHKQFAQGRDSWEDGEHTGWPRIVRTVLKVQEVAMLVHASRSQTVDEAAAEGITHGTCHKIMSDDLNMSCDNERSVSCILTQGQADHHVCTSDDKDGTFSNQITTGGKTRSFLYDPQLKMIPPGNHHHHQERRSRDRSDQKARKCLN
jgi:hypothetical protein